MTTITRFTKERIIEDLKASTQNCSGMFEISEDTICALMSMLYAAPQLPQPAVPDAISTRQAISKMEECEPCDSINVAYKYGWNACRAAMLQGSQPVNNRDELPDIVGLKWSTKTGHRVRVFPVSVFRFVWG